MMLCQSVMSQSITNYPAMAKLSILLSIWIIFTLGGESFIYLKLYLQMKTTGVEGNNWKNKLEHQCTNSKRDQCTSLSFSNKRLADNPRMFCQYRCCNETPTRMGMSSCDWSKDCHVYQDKFLCFYKNSADGSIKNVMWQ